MVLKIMVYLPENEYNVVKKYTTKMKISMSAFARQAIKEKIQKNKSPEIVKEGAKSIDAFRKEILTELNKVMVKVGNVENKSVLIEAAIQTITQYKPDNAEFKKPLKIGTPRKKVKKKDVRVTVDKSKHIK